MLNNILSSILSFFRPFIYSISYCGYKLKVSKGTSILSQISNGVYEENISTQIKKDIEANGIINFIDIGANIGLISIFLLSKFPRLKIYAFEPGPHQYMLFKKTIEENNIDDIKLKKIALSNKKGHTTFYSHSSQHVSGDGFVDTGTAGEAKKITVKTDLLDNQLNKIIGKTLIKIDTEGSEQLVLLGSVIMLIKIRPIIYFEMWPKYLKLYGLSPLTMVKFLHKYKYAIVTTNGEKVNLKNISKIAPINANYIAYPQ